MGLICNKVELKLSVQTFLKHKDKCKMFEDPIRLCLA